MCIRDRAWNPDKKRLGKGLGSDAYCIGGRLKKKRPVSYTHLDVYKRQDMGVAAYGIVANLALVAVSIFTGISQGVQPMISRFPVSYTHLIYK